MKDGMILYSSYIEKFKKLSDEQFGQLIRLIFQYQIDGVVPSIEDTAISLAFDVAKFDLDRNNKKYEEICEKRREAGSKGGLAKASNSKQMLANASNSKQNIANVADKEKDKEKDKVIIYKDNRERVKSTRFTPPTLEEVTEYCKERNNNVDPERFIDFYSSKGWMVGSNKMKDWKACVRTWEKRDSKPKQEEPTKEESNKHKRYDKYEALERFYLGEE